ncbi:3-keto-disaccharide hydrolase [Sediminicola luteus]|uniref:3-keto-alpha-glucoside-1,2-lyase/3-keto-2-hydroxy-glucal hydratase domain-containing protein n=1 Tax=Sediminicola luteus TaxID=319238 RepID=A0A2A4GEB1_9FLAO|nr:DUF1080 domain-containing protein [Sediminicola luteus]PCE66751.1 hypothetical protein B7P33_01340 [Sediminicola luteus]
MKKGLTVIGFIAAVIIVLWSCASQKNQSPDKENWVSIFNGKDLEGWTPKIRGYELGDNHLNTFRVENGVLKASYADYEQFDSKFGHLFYKQKYSHYRLRAQYRMVGEQVKGGPGWAFANNGFMLHCQDPATMTLDQSFPASFEFQLLAEQTPGKSRPTGNLCTPGCHVTLNGEFTKAHCMPNTQGATYPREKWVQVEAVVLGDSIVHHIVEGDTVLTYTNPILDLGLDGLDKSKFTDGAPITEGYIAIQGESHDTEFRNLEVLDLCGCKDKKAKNYKSYYVKHNQDDCEY